MNYILQLYIITIALAIIHEKHVVLCDELRIPVVVGLFTGLHGGWLYIHMVRNYTNI